MKRLLIALLLFCFVSTARAEHPDPSSGLIQYQKPRPDITTGYGPVIDDLEQMATTHKHGMREPNDPGGWAHELTQFINGEMRDAVSIQLKRRYNSFYVLDGYALWLPEPDITLADIAKLVPEEYHNIEYKVYLVWCQRYWNKQPLFILDEATAVANALQYHVTARQPKVWRETKATYAIYFSKLLLQAVEEGDPGYDHLPQLRAFIEWHNARCWYLIRQHRALSTPSR